MKLREKTNSIKKYVKSVRVKLFLTITLTITVVVIMLIAINSAVLEKFYLYNRTKAIKEMCDQVNAFYNNRYSYEEIEHNLKVLSINSNSDILIKNNDNKYIYVTGGALKRTETDGDFETNFKMSTENMDVLYKEKNYEVKSVREKSTTITYIIADYKMQNGYELLIRSPITGLKESARISNNLLLTIGIAAILISGVVSSFVSRRFTKPIIELNDIANSMCNLNFSKKYFVNDEDDDEINALGKSINTMSDKLESTIKQLEANNSELEKDVERKSKIDEMRKQFISDVSHELKTPIALIQGYAEGLVENVNTDDESRKFYAEVILDEANKMDVLVKQLLELMKLEYGKRDFNNQSFDIISLIKEVIRKTQVMIDENKITVNFNCERKVEVYADSFYIEQVVTNYITNAIKYSKEINNERKIVINVVENEKNKKVRVNIFNTGDNMSESDLQRIWGRFYKTDSSRNRQNGGTGIGLAIVKAVMNNYKNEYGAINKENGIEFFFELDKNKKRGKEKQKINKKVGCV